MLNLGKFLFRQNWNRQRRFGLSDFQGTTWQSWQNDLILVACAWTLAQARRDYSLGRQPQAALPVRFGWERRLECPLIVPIATAPMSVEDAKNFRNAANALTLTANRSTGVPFGLPPAWGTPTTPSRATPPFPLQRHPRQGASPTTPPKDQPLVAQSQVFQHKLQPDFSPVRR